MTVTSPSPRARRASQRASCVSSGRPELVDEAWFATGHGRVEHADEIDAAVAAWIGARSRDEVLAAFDEAEAAAAAVYDAADILADPHLRETGAFATVEDGELGPIVMTGPIARLSSTPAAIRFAGGRHGADTDRVLGELGLPSTELERHRGGAA